MFKISKSIIFTAAKILILIVIWFEIAFWSKDLLRLVFLSPLSNRFLEMTIKFTATDATKTMMMILNSDDRDHDDDWDHDDENDDDDGKVEKVFWRSWVGPAAASLLIQSILAILNFVSAPIHHNLTPKTSPICFWKKGGFGARGSKTHSLKFGWSANQLECDKIQQNPI